MKPSIFPLFASLLACSACANTVEGLEGPGASPAAIAAEPNTASTTGAIVAGDGNATANANDGNGIAESISAQAVVLSGTAPAAAEGKKVLVRALSASGKVVAEGNATVAGGKFSASLSLGEAAANTNAIAVYVDLNADGICSISPSDIGSLLAPAADGNLTLALNANSSPPCAAFGDFSLAAGGNDFVPHNGQALYAALRDVQAKVYVTSPEGTRVANATWALKFPGALVKGRTYELRYFADIAATGKCQDHSWLAKVPAVTGDVTLHVSHDTAQTPVCDSFPALPASAIVPKATATP